MSRALTMLQQLLIILTTLLVLTLKSDAGWSGSLLSSPRRLTSQRRDPGPGKRAGAPLNGTADAIQSAFDHDVLHRSHKALGTRSSRGRAEGHAPACDRSGGKCALCALTRGSWCEEYYRQERVAWKKPPRGNKDCPSTRWGPCNGVGNCHYDIGVCQCPAGWRGAACDEPDKRPCTNNHKSPEQPLDLIMSHIGPDGLDLDLSAGGWAASRCGGFCDDDRGSCWCPPNTTYGRKPPPPGSPPWVRYSQRGRVILEACKPGKVPNKEGKIVTNDWGQKGLSLDDLIGPKGWCNAKSPNEVAGPAHGPCMGGRGCQEEGLVGLMCEVAVEETCLNQCSGHGECDAGYCRCHQGWYGEDCARKKAGEPLEPGLMEARPWLKPVVMPVLAAAEEPPAAAAGSGPAGATGSGAEQQQQPGRLRPLIYIYDMPPEFTSRMLQYKLVNDHCGYRSWREGNRTEVYGDNYSLEVYLHEMLAISQHRTFDPEEADFFYVPVYYGCFMWPINGWADMPFWGAPTSWHRYSNAAHMWLAAKNWIQSHFPYWDRRGGRDHIWMTNHDEGACYMPTEIYNASIMLTHWGRLDPDHKSNTAYHPDNYSNGIKWPGVLGGQDVKILYEGHPCYNPKKDLVVPGFKPPNHFSSSPLLGSAPYERDILLYLRGDVGKYRQPNYSRGIRQKLYKLATDLDWATKHRIFIAEKYELQGSYGEHLARSIFCVVVPGDGFSMRFEDAVLHGCLPLILMDHTHAVFESVVDIDAFSLRINEEAVDEHLPLLLKAISPEQIERMQRRLALVWHRFAYAHGPLVHSSLRQTMQHNLEQKFEVPASHPYQPVQNFPVHTDAMATILQWLHGRIAETRGSA
ncbi:hypothetical protein Agub_g6421 [Astrephomene gubernaculifera]|uniref:EGF-like domain-containing protein n=1 Tax=Astrephomene gubernaculifera TaxID=47775 RepID=A0AAD3HLT1_9CHLO|nr:hypothetical protein Agub_g6421 [Astrephomene gubernaculifera]